MRFGLSEVEKRDVWSRWKAGQTLHEIGRIYDKLHTSIRAVLLPRGGIPPGARRRSRVALTLAEREDISRGVASGSSLREIARLLNRATSTVSREVARHQPAAAAILPARNRPVPHLSSAARPRLAALESTAQKNLRIPKPASKLQASVASTV
jgi:DNA-binding CsgD family transcriptional regulator